MDERSKDLTTFTSHFGLFRFLRMPFGLKNAPATFQRVMNIILSSVHWQFALVYLDDVIVFSKTLDEHFDHVRTVLRLLRNAGVTIRLDKCSFFATKVEYLGHTITPGKLAIHNRACDAVEQFKPLRTTTDIRSFLGLCNVFRRFVPNFSRVAAPLNKKLKKGQPSTFDELTQEEHGAYQPLKQALSTPPVLALPKLEGRYTVYTDSCDK